MDTGEKFPLVKEGNKATHGIESLDTRLSKLEAERERSKLAQEAMRAEFQDYKEQLNVSLKEHLTHIMELQLRLTEAEDKLSRLQPEKQQPSQSLARAQASSGASLRLCASCGTPNLETQIAQTKGKSALITLGTLPSTLSDDSVTQTMDGKNKPRIEEPKALQATEESAAVPVFSSVGKSCSSVFKSAPLFTIGRGESSDEEADDEVLSPSKISSPSKQNTTAEKPSTPLLPSNPTAGFPFGLNTRTKFSCSPFLGLPSRKPKSPEPLIPLPEKIEVKTGEEDEDVLFAHRAKLYRFVAEDKQWKERGVGDIKLLKNKTSGRMRVLMRREQVKKLCANHQITEDMKLQPNACSDRSWVWSTLADFSEQECRAERLAVRFKMDTTARQFKEKFEECQEMLKQQIPEACKERVTEDIVTQFKPDAGSWECDTCLLRNNSDKIECAACGTLKPGAEPSQAQQTSGKPVFPFGAAASSSGEEDEDVLFAHRAKLYRFVAEDKQWKERGVGDIKLLKNKTSGRMRVLMRREQVKKLCANHQITEDMKLQPNAGSDRSWVWSTLADFSEQECRAERLAVRFKTDVPAKQFKEKFEKCQEMLKQQIPGASKEHVTENLVTQFKPQTGSWECDTCLVRNNSDKAECAACGTHKPGTEPSQAQQTSGKPVFPFGVNTSSTGSGIKFGISGDSNKQNQTFTFGSLNQRSYSTSASGSSQTREKAANKEKAREEMFVKFKLQTDTWECNSCMVRNINGKIECAACGTPKPGAKQRQAQQTSGKPVFPFGAATSSSLSSSGLTLGFSGDSKQRNQTFTFGSSRQTTSSTRSNQTQEKAADKDLFAKLKPQTRPWECCTCMVRNNSDKIECAACGTLKPGAEPSQAQQTSGKPVFSFGAGVSSGFGLKSGISRDSKERNQTLIFGSSRQTTSSTSGPRSNQTQEKEADKDLFAKLKPQTRSWECNTCMVRNNSDKIECASCGTHKPGAEANRHRR